MRNQTVDWDATQKVYVKRIIKHIIVACGCVNDETGEYVNECGTENCPLLNGKIKGIINGNGLDRFTYSAKEENKE